MDQARASLGIASIDLKVRANRLCYIARVAHRSPVALEILLDTSAAEPWLREVAVDIGKIQSEMKELQKLPHIHELSDMRPWLCLFAAHLPA